MCITEISKLKWRTDVDVVSGVHKSKNSSRQKKIIWHRLVLFWRSVPHFFLIFDQTPL